MPRKRDMDKTYGEKVIRLFASLLFARRPHSLTELANMLDCSKQTIARIVRDIEASYQIEVERMNRGREALYAIKSRKPPPAAYLSPSEMNLLWMCRAFTERLLGKQLFQNAKDALDKSQALLRDQAALCDANFACFHPGTVDYTPHKETISTLIRAMNEKRVCKVTYKSPYNERSKTFYIKPLKIFSHKDALYLHAVRAKDPWQKKYIEPEFDPLLAIQRFKKVEIDETKAHFEVPKEYDFQKAFNQTFGIIKDEKFEVEAEFTGWAAVYVEERIWSNDQVISQEGDKIRIKFTASSEPEIISWVLSFGDQAKLLEPEFLVKQISTIVFSIRNQYGGGYSYDE
ncbi:MAG: WYL domain-containing protein [Deltaproteobacteria bacterium]